MEKQRNTTLYHLFEVAYCNNKGNLDVCKIEPFLDKHVTLRVVQKNGHIVGVNERVDNVKLVISGGFYVIKTSPAGFSNIMAQQTAPQLIGVRQLLLATMNSCPEIIATKKCVILEIEQEYFTSSLMQDGRLAILIIQNLLQKDEEALARMEHHLYYTTPQNVLLYIYHAWLAEHGGSPYQKPQGKNTQVAYQLPLNNELIASRLGVCNRTLVRAIKKLKDSGSLTVVKRKITLTHNQLEQLQEFHLNIQ